MSSDKKVICLIDDERAIFSTMEIYLEEKFGDKFELHCFDSVVGAEAFFSHSKADVLITDLSVNNHQNNLNSLIRLQKLKHPQMKVILASIYDEKTAGERLARGFDALPSLKKGNPAADLGSGEIAMTPNRMALLKAAADKAESAAAGTLNRHLDYVITKNEEFFEKVCTWLDENVFNVSRAKPSRP